MSLLNCHEIKSCHIPSEHNINKVCIVVKVCSLLLLSPYWSEKRHKNDECILPSSHNGFRDNVIVIVLNFQDVPSELPRNQILSYHCQSLFFTYMITILLQERTRK